MRERAARKYVRHEKVWVKAGANEGKNRDQSAGSKDEYHVEAAQGVVEEDENSGSDAENVD